MNSVIYLFYLYLYVIYMLSMLSICYLYVIYMLSMLSICYLCYLYVIYVIYMLSMLSNSGYTIEKLNTSTGNWENVSSFIPKEATEFIVPKLKEGKEYEFRVMAENAQVIRFAIFRLLFYYHMHHYFQIDIVIISIR